MITEQEYYINPEIESYYKENIDLYEFQKKTYYMQSSSEFEYISQTIESYENLILQLNYLEHMYNLDKVGFFIHIEAYHEQRYQHHYNYNNSLSARELANYDMEQLLEEYNEKQIEYI